MLREPKIFLKLINKDMLEFYNTENKWEDSGFDLHFPKSIVCQPKSTTKIPLGVVAAVFENSDNMSKPYYLYPRSSISKTPLRLANSVGIIDSQYRGELCVVLDNISDEPYNIERGQRLFQICSRNLEPFKSVEFVETFSETERGENGFGSTGTN